LRLPDESNTPRVYALDFSCWKKSAVRQCFPHTEVNFVTSASHVPEGAILLVWGMRSICGESAAGVKVLRIEDGFLRSVGLGADLIRPVSLVIDGLGIYYDSTQASDLEILLANTNFSPDCLHRAEEVRRNIIAARLTKYNVGATGWTRPYAATHVILVPGQVESDDSLRYGAPGIRLNIDLLKAVRMANPGAYIVYKPHPDVVAGLRATGAGEHDATRWCDEMVTDSNMSDLLKHVDEVHALTSLAGFEALLRHKAVTCYGQPFYSGWGLTTDMIPHPRRIRRLSLNELIAGTLILYPKYLSRDSNKLISPEQAIDELVAWRAKANIAPWWRELSRNLLRRVVGVR
jgi:capsular polysaccharide export protein